MQENKNLVEEVEAQVDEVWQKTPLPGLDWSIAAWHVLTVYEDSLRLALAQKYISLEDAQIDVVEKIASLKCSLDLLRQHLSVPQRPGPQAITDPDLYSKAAILMQRASSYASAVLAFVSYHIGAADCEVVETNRTVLKFVRAGSKTAFNLRMLVRNPLNDNSLFELVAAQLLGQTNTFYEVIEAIIPHASVIGEANISRVEYSVTKDLCALIAKQLPNSSRITPLGWKFPWGESARFSSLINALKCRCVYHVLAVHYAALDVIEGCGVDSIVLVTTRRQLANEIRLITGFPEAEILQGLRALEYGNGVTHPDPALQPLIPLDGGRIAIPCLYLIALDFERNMLSLHARIHSKSFDAQSWSFEKKMVADVIASLSDSGFDHLIANKTVRLHTDSRRPRVSAEREFDLIIVDDSCHEIIVSEFKWAIRPAEPREFARRDSDCIDKVRQTRDKIDFALQDLDQFLAKIGVGGSVEDGWKVYGAAVFVGVSGCPVNDVRDVCSVPVDVYIDTLRRERSLGAAHDYWTSLAWLPQEGTDYRVDYVEAEIGNVTIKWPAVRFESLRDTSRSRGMEGFAQHVLENNTGLAGLVVIRVFFNYDELREAFPEYASNFSAAEPEEWGSFLLRVMRAQDDLMIMGILALDCEIATGAQGAVASAILNQVTGDSIFKAVVRKPRLYFRVDESGVYVAVVVDDRFWTDAW